MSKASSISAHYWYASSIP